MANYTFTNNSLFPVGTTVGAYPVSTIGDNPPNAAPGGSAVNSQTMGANGCVFTGLTPGVSYYAYAAVNTVPTYQRFMVGEDFARTTLRPSGLAAPGVVPGFNTWQPVAATSGTDTAFANGTLFLSSLYLPINKVATGIGFLLGSVGGTDKVIVGLWDGSGNPVANSTTAAGGTTAGTAANTQEIPFVNPLSLVGPGVYFLGVAANGATAKLRTVAAFTNAGSLAGSVSWTHGTIAAVVPPQTFTADKAPIAYVY